MNATTLACCLALSLTVALPASAQAPPSYDGSWRASFKRADGTGRTFDAALKLSGDSGTWKVFNVQSRQNACLGMVAPVRDVEVTDQGLNFQIKGSDAIVGCPDPKVSVMKTDTPNVLKGTYGRDFLIEISRD